LDQSPLTKVVDN